MLLEDVGRLGKVLEPLDGKFADRLQHPEAVAGVTKEALVDERLEDVELGAAHGFGGVESAAAGENGEQREQRLFLGG